MASNPYVYDKAKIAQQEASRLELEAKIKAVTETGRLCLDNPLFKRYKDAHLSCREYIIKLMKENVEPDPVKFAFFMKSCIAKIDTLDMLLDAVSKDASRKVKA